MASNKKNSGGQEQVVFNELQQQKSLFLREFSTQPDPENITIQGVSDDEISKITSGSYFQKAYFQLRDVIADFDPEEGKRFVLSRVLLYLRVKERLKQELSGVMDKSSFGLLWQGMVKNDDEIVKIAAKSFLPTLRLGSGKDGKIEDLAERLFNERFEGKDSSELSPHDQAIFFEELAGVAGFRCLSVAEFQNIPGFQIVYDQLNKLLPEKSLAEPISQEVRALTQKLSLNIEAREALSKLAKSADVQERFKEAQKDFETKMIDVKDEVETLKLLDNVQKNFEEQKKILSNLEQPLTDYHKSGREYFVYEQQRTTYQKKKDSDTEDQTFLKSKKIAEITVTAIKDLLAIEKWLMEKLAKTPNLWEKIADKSKSPEQRVKETEEISAFLNLQSLLGKLLEQDINLPGSFSSLINDDLALNPTFEEKSGFFQNLNNLKNYLEQGLLGEIESRLSASNVKPVIDYDKEILDLSGKMELKKNEISGLNNRLLLNLNSLASQISNLESLLPDFNVKKIPPNWEGNPEILNNFILEQLVAINKCLNSLNKPINQLPNTHIVSHLLVELNQKIFIEKQRQPYLSLNDLKLRVGGLEALEAEKQTLLRKAVESPARFTPFALLFSINRELAKTRNLEPAVAETLAYESTLNDVNRSTPGYEATINHHLAQELIAQESLLKTAWQNLFKNSFKTWPEVWEERLKKSQLLAGIKEKCLNPYTSSAQFIVLIDQGKLTLDGLFYLKRAAQELLNNSLAEDIKLDPSVNLLTLIRNLDEAVSLIHIREVIEKLRPKYMSLTETEIKPEVIIKDLEPIQDKYTKLASYSTEELNQISLSRLPTKKEEKKPEPNNLSIAVMAEAIFSGMVWLAKKFIPGLKDKK